MGLPLDPNVVSWYLRDGLVLLALKVSAVCYAIVGAAGLLDLRRPSEDGERIIVVGLAIAATVHALALVGRTQMLAAFPVTGLADGLSLSGLVVALLALRLTWTRTVPQAASVASLLSAVMVCLAVLFFPALGDVRLASPWLPFHITFAFLGVATFAVAGIVAALYVVQERRLKSKGRRGASRPRRLPSLESLDRVSFQLIKLGFPLLGIGLVLGVVQSKYSTGHYWNWNLLNTLAVGIWLMFALLLNLRLTIGWRGRRVALLTLGGVALTLGALLTQLLTGSGPHGVPGQ